MPTSRYCVSLLQIDGTELSYQEELALDADVVYFDNTTNNFSADNVQDAIEEAYDAAVGVSGNLITFSGFGTGVTKNKYLNVEHPSNSSDSSPWVTPFNGNCIALSYTNSNSSTNTDVLFKVNGTTQYTWQIRNKKTAYKVLNSGMFSLSQGDRISIYLDDVTGTSPGDPNITFILSVTTLPDGEGGT